jgi:hypothetical protein
LQLPVLLIRHSVNALLWMQMKRLCPRTAHFSIGHWLALALRTTSFAIAEAYGDPFDRWLGAEATSPTIASRARTAVTRKANLRNPVIFLTSERRNGA